MIVTIWRHGEAGEAADDRQRELTARGRRDITGACPLFLDACERWHLPVPDTIAHSPWRRTAQTARIISRACGQVRRLALEPLQPGSSIAGVDVVLDGLAGTADVRHLLLVGHQPLVSTLIDHYLGERGRVPGVVPGGFAVIDLPAPLRGSGSLHFWAMPPAYEAQSG